MLLVDYVKSLFKDYYKGAVVSLMVENLELARDKKLPNFMMKELGIPSSMRSRLFFQAGALDAAIKELESFEYSVSRGETFDSLAEAYWDAIESPSILDEVQERWLSQNLELLDDLRAAHQGYLQEYGQAPEEYTDLLDELVNISDFRGSKDLVIGGEQDVVDLPFSFWRSLDETGSGDEVIDYAVYDCEMSYDRDYIRGEAIVTLPTSLQSLDIDSDTFDEAFDAFINSIKESVDFFLFIRSLDLRLVHVNEYFDAKLGASDILKGIEQLTEAVLLILSEVEVQDSIERLSRKGDPLGRVFVRSLADFTVSDIERLKDESSLKGLPFVLVQEGKDIAVPSEYSNVFDHVYLLGCFGYASAKHEVKVQFQTYTGVIEFVNDNRYLIRDFGVRGVPPHLPYLNVVDLDVGLGAEVRIPLALLENRYRDIRIQSRNAVRLTTPTWDGLKCAAPKLHLCLDYTETVQVDFSEIDRLFFTKKAYIGCDIKQLQNQEESGYLGKRFPSEFRCSGSLCVVEDGAIGALVFSNMRYGYETLIAASGAFFKTFGNEPTLHFDHLRSPKGFSEVYPKRGEAYSNSIVWSFPGHADYSGCSFYKCILLDGEPENSVSVLALNEKYDQTIVVSK